MHPNGVRMHLERLAEAGLVLREREHLARGRPRDTWTISPEALPGGDPPSGYAELGRFLAQVITAAKIRLRDIEMTGRKLGHELVASHDTAGEEQLFALLANMGFRPRRELACGDRLTYRLGNCPYRETVAGHRQVVCTLHRGLTRGMLDALDPKTKLAGFVVRDPHTAGCLIELRGPLASEASKTLKP